MNLKLFRSRKMNLKLFSVWENEFEKTFSVKENEFETVFCLVNEFEIFFLF